jgi:hypothetical protein
MISLKIKQKNGLKDAQQPDTSTNTSASTGQLMFKKGNSNVF